MRTDAELIQCIEAMYESEPLSTEYMGEHCLEMRRTLNNITPLDVDLPSTDCVSQLLLLMKRHQAEKGYIHNALIALFIQRAIKRSIEASRAHTVNHFSDVLKDFMFFMVPLPESDYGVHPRIDFFDDYVSLVEQAETALVAHVR